MPQQEQSQDRRIIKVNLKIIHINVQNRHRRYRRRHRVLEHTQLHPHPGRHCVKQNL
jgi:hypothetical protein